MGKSIFNANVTMTKTERDYDALTKVSSERKIIAGAADWVIEFDGSLESLSYGIATKLQAFVTEVDLEKIRDNLITHQDNLGSLKSFIYSEKIGRFEWFFAESPVGTWIEYSMDVTEVFEKKADFTFV